MAKVIKIAVFLVVCAACLAIGWYSKSLLGETAIEEIPQTIATRKKPLEKYQIDALSQNEVPPGEFYLTNDTTSPEDSFASHTFEMKFDPALSSTEKKVSGTLNIPEGSGHPLVVMIRGYVDQKLYTPGTGTKNAAKFFAENGYMTVALDYLGYGSSDSESANIFESRFQTYTTTLTLLSTIKSQSFAKATGGKWDGKNIFMWAHSNGGQIALTTLEITGADIPTTLWAPVTKPFPYSVLYYTDESEDGGKLIRRELAKFETDYDTDKYSLTKYLDKLNAPMQFSQGTLDDAVPADWTSNFVKKLKQIDKDAEIYLYKGADHNLKPSWDMVISQDLRFFKDHTRGE